MKKPLLTAYHHRNRLNRLATLKINHGKNIEQLVNDGYTIGQIISSIGCPKKTMVYYLESEGLLTKCQSNWINKRINLAKSNGRQSRNTLSGVLLKPITQEIKNWFQTQLTMGKFKWEVRKELQNKFGYGEKKYYQLCKEFGFPKNNPQSGNLNPMYGKSPDSKSGIGVNGWVFIDGNKLLFRSSLELKIFLYLQSVSVKFLPSTHRIEYEHKGATRTYVPDRVIGNTVYEIKPTALLTNELVTAKFTALQKYCTNFNLTCAFITESTYPLFKLTQQWVDELIKRKQLIIDQKNYNKLMRYL